jgi:hypothetical protein
MIIRIKRVPDGFWTVECKLILNGIDNPQYYTTQYYGFGRRGTGGVRLLESHDHRNQEAAVTALCDKTGATP